MPGRTASRSFCFVVGRRPSSPQSLAVLLITTSLRFVVGRWVASTLGLAAPGERHPKVDVRVEC